MRSHSQAPHYGAVRRPVAAALPVAMPAPLSPLPVAIPAAVCAIFAQWGEPYDPALLIAGPGDIRPLSAFYRRLGASSGGLRVNMRELFQIWRDADLNTQFGLDAELRREGAAVAAWVDAAAQVFFPINHLPTSLSDEVEHALIDPAAVPDEQFP